MDIDSQNMTVEQAQNIANDVWTGKIKGGGRFSQRYAAHLLSQEVDRQATQLKAAQARIEELEKSKLSDLFLANFPYEDWRDGEDDRARIGDWVHLGWQDHNGADHSDGIGRVCLHHDTEIPVILMVEGFEDDGEPHGSYSSMSFHPWNTISRISEDEARQALKETP